eukprot:519171-Amphidinium_carterae.1
MVLVVVFCFPALGRNFNMPRSKSASSGLPLLDKEAVNKAWKYVWDMLELDTNGGSGHAHRVFA